MRGSKTKPARVRVLTDKQRRFVDEYMLDCNATQAAIRAGFKAKSAQEQGSRLLSNVMVAVELQRRQDALARKFDVTAERVIAEYVKLASSRITDYLTFRSGGVTLLNSEQIAGHRLDAIAEVSEVLGKEGYRGVRFKLHSKVDALDALGKHLGLFVERHQVDISERLSEALDTIKSRLSPAAQQELTRAVGDLVAQNVAPGADAQAETDRGEGRTPA